MKSPYAKATADADKGGMNVEIGEWSTWYANQDDALALSKIARLKAEVDSLTAKLDKAQEFFVATEKHRDKRRFELLDKIGQAQLREDRAVAALTIALETTPDKRLVAMLDEIIAKRQLVETQAAEISFHQKANRERNTKLDALHYVWCDGGCKDGIHRYGEHPPLTREIVREAMRNTRRLAHWFVNHERKSGRGDASSLLAELTGPATLEETLRMQVECDDLRDERDEARFQLAKLRAYAAHAAMPHGSQILRAFCVCGNPTGPGTDACDALRVMPRGER